jgi:hypothetical protein
MTSACLNFDSSNATITKLASLLSQIDPDVDYRNWMLALMVVFYETRSSEEGFELADQWSSGGTKYRGERDVRRMWRSFNPNHPRPVRMGTLVRLAKQFG